MPNQPSQGRVTRKDCVDEFSGATPNYGKTNSNDASRQNS